MTAGLRVYFVYNLSGVTALASLGFKLQLSFDRDNNRLILSGRVV